ncbi:uncharacterized protein [Rutidosis leptorrhynchoides]|uniref:uncharacterized protein n=1 Tax=Rutidosis leptorrhynchoides TaxID=125765 RepID=UPI003A99B7EC
MSITGRYKGTPAERTRVKERYKEAKREAKKAVAIAKDKAYEDLYRKLDSIEGANDIYRIAKARERRGRDLVNVKYIKDEAGQNIVREDLIMKRWEEYFASLFGRERTERNGELHKVRKYQNNCFCMRINQEKVRSALRMMGRNKAVGPDQIPIEAWRCLGGDGVRWLTKLFNTTFRSAKMPMEWRLSEVIPIYKNKEDAQICSNYREVDLHQGSALSPYLFALILDELTKRIQDNIPWCLIFADDIVLVSDSQDELNRRLEQWMTA